MKITFQFALFFILSLLAYSCDPHSKDDDFGPRTPNNNNPDLTVRHTLEVDYKFGKELSPKEGKNIYVIWIEDETSGFIQSLSVCRKLIIGGLAGTALPYWKINKYPVSSGSEIDAVTTATQANEDFSVSTVLKDVSVRKFTIYFEMDRSFEDNDWFSDQPALLYAAEIDLNEDKIMYELVPVGWTTNENSQNIIPNSPMGQLQTEMRYITHHKNGSSFGAPDERSLTEMTKKITVTIK